jgi:hypothetical protein
MTTHFRISGRGVDTQILMDVERDAGRGEQTEKSREYHFVLDLVTTRSIQFKYCSFVCHDRRLQFSLPSSLGMADNPFVSVPPHRSTDQLKPLPSSLSAYSGDDVKRRLPSIHQFASKEKKTKEPVRRELVESCTLDAYTASDDAS